MKYIYATEELLDYCKSENRIAIYGAGDWGKTLADYMIAAGMNEKICGMVVTRKDEADSSYRGIQIHQADRFLGQDQCGVIIASWKYHVDIAQIVEQYGKKYCCLSQDLYWAMEDISDLREKVPYRGIDFLVPGFTKCGSTSLHRALMTVEDIYLAKQKESHLFSWYDKVQDPHKVLAEKYFNNIREGQFVGMVEPTFVEHAKEVYDFFGPHVKLIFLVRNPVESTFSRFKMMLRGGVGGERFFQEYREYSLNMFDEYADLDKGGSHGTLISKYIDWINSFKEYYPADQMMIVCFEELIRNTSEVMRSILNFIGSRHTYEYKDLPLENEGNYIMADLDSYKLARRYKKMCLEYKFCFGEDISKRNQMYSELVQAQREFDQAKKIYNVHMSEEQRKKLEAYYNDSVRQLEDCIHKDLSGIWF